MFITSLDTSGLPQSGSSAQALLEGGLTGAVSSLGAGRLRRRVAHRERSCSTPPTSAGAFVPGTARARTAGARDELPRRHLPGLLRRSRRGHRQELRRDRQRIGLEERDRHLARRRAHHTAHPATPSRRRRDRQRLRRSPKRCSSQFTAPGGLAGQGVSLLGQLFAGAQTASLSVTPTPNSISLQGEVHSANGSTPLFGQEGAKALGELPERLVARRGRRQRRRQPSACAWRCCAAWRRSAPRPSSPRSEERASKSSSRRSELAERETATGLRRVGGLRWDVRERHGPVQPRSRARDRLQRSQRLPAQRSASSGT